MNEFTLNVNIAVDTETIVVPCNTATTAEDVCIFICKQRHISPLTRHLFGLRIEKSVFLPPKATVKNVKDTPVDFRIRYKVPMVRKLEKIDLSTYNYYFHQARNDVLDNKVPDLVYEKHRRELVGLGITDMHRVILEKGIAMETVEKEYKKYIPKEVSKRHPFFIKVPIHNNLVKLQKSVKDVMYVKAEYIKQLELIAPEYLSEEFKAFLDEDGHCYIVIIKVSPLENESVKYCFESKREQWHPICTIDEISGISIRENTAEINRTNGIPFYLRFHGKSILYSFISLLDGYYRLSCKWTFNICSDLCTPSLEKLKAMKCHGPVGGEFSYAKLEERLGNKPGSFIIRESEKTYNTYYIDVCMRDRRPKSFKLERIPENEFIFHDDTTKYKNIQELMQAYKDPNGVIYLQECLPPSDYDVSPLLLCKSDHLSSSVVVSSSSVNDILSTPLCINYNDLQIFKAETPPGNLTDITICKLSHLGLEYLGAIAKTESDVRCQSWTADAPHKVPEDLNDESFAEFSRKKAKNYCRNPDKRAEGPWCYTMNYDLQYETCGISLCSYSQCRLTGPGMDYGGQHNKGSSDRKCLKWNKDRKKVKIADSNFTKIDKFPKHRFPENDLGNAKKFCRNPDGDIGGPWCFVENEYTEEIKKEYCDIPFCDDKECSLFSTNSFTYMHYTDFNNSLENMTFSVKLWDSDSYSTASARLVLSVLALPLTGSEIRETGVGIEVFIGNNVSGLRYGNKDNRPDYEPTPGILKSSEYTTFSLSWHAGFITLSKDGEIKPIFLAEIKTNKNLMGFKKNEFNFYSAQGTHVLWNFPFCMDDFDCDVQTTTGKEFQQFWPMRGKSLGYDLYVHIRAHHSASILFLSSPTADYPYLKIVFKGSNNFTRITLKEFAPDSETVLKELQLTDIVNYWQWSEFSISMFANSLQVYMKKAIGLHSLLETKHEVFRNLRWFSVSSDNTVAHWSFYCKPPVFSNPPPALLPECALNPQELTYKGTQDISSTGLPCLPWSGTGLIPDDVESLFVNESTLSAWNYCRNPSGVPGGTYCYTISLSPDKKIERTFCHLRKCKSEMCKVAGTGNDFIGAVAVTRSGRPCDGWVLNLQSVHGPYMYTYNDSWFAEMSQAGAQNFCRNPSRDVSGSWCFTRDPQLVMDVCDIKDCDRPEECITIINTKILNRKIFILPQWKESGLQGGLRFSVKEWNPDVLDGVQFVFYPREGSGEVKLLIGANYNEKVILYKNDQLIEQKTLPHLIAAGKWTDFWLQIRRGEIMLGFEGVPTALFEWRDPDMASAFEPMLMAYGVIFGDPIGLFFKSEECHTENTTDTMFLKFMSMGIWTKTESSVHRNMTFKVRGVGVAWLSFMWVTNNFMSYLVQINTDLDIIQLVRVDAPPHATQGFQHLLMKSATIPNVMNPTNWTNISIFTTERRFVIARNDKVVIDYNSDRPIVIYWFSVAIATGWITWTANCEPLDLDGPPKDGGWSAWSPWVCSVACGGGEGYRTRTCSNPRPNMMGRLCVGPPTATGVCNDFPCGDISPDTLEKIRTKLQTESHSFTINEDESIVLKNDPEIIKIIKKESPEAYYEWSFNGLVINKEEGDVTLKYDDVSVSNAKQKHSGLYVCMLHRINKKRVIFRVVALAVKSKKYDVITRAARQYTLICNAVILGHKKEGLRGMTMVYRAMWKPAKGKKLEVAMKMLNQESSDRYLKDFMSLVGKWAFLRSSAVVRFYGLAIGDNNSSILEYLPLGSLDKYLREKRDILKPEDLIEASSNLAAALWHLKENNIVHGKIRCRKLLVNVHNEKSFTVKLTDPGIHTFYAPTEVHWIPVECYSNTNSSFEYAKRSPAADVWAFATTLWEIFTFGTELDRDYSSFMKFYKQGRRLPRPKTCQEAMYEIMKKCWEADPDRRIQPQELMRDINQILYEIYDSRRNHSYARPLPSSKITASTSSMASEAITETTEVGDLLDFDKMKDSLGRDWPSEETLPCECPSFTPTFESNEESVEGFLNSIVNVFDLDGDNVVLQGRIGQGFYGEVYKATLDYDSGVVSKSVQVAVKKLKDAQSRCIQDFEREINIMKQLEHENIVKILGVYREDQDSGAAKINLVMEFIPLGSLKNHLDIYKDYIKDKQLLKYALDIAKGMDYLGTKNIVHRDLATRNILVVDENHVKISDFGLARVIGTNDYYMLRTDRELPIKWYAPETLNNGKYSVRSDVWSYGVTMCEMFNNGDEPQLPNVGDSISQQEFLAALQNGHRFPCPPRCPHKVYTTIIFPCWHIDSHKRPSFSDLIGLIAQTDGLLN